MPWTLSDVLTTINMDGVWITSKSTSGVLCKEVHFVEISIFFKVQCFILKFLKMHLN